MPSSTDSVPCEVAAMFDMLSMTQYAKPVMALGYRTVESLFPALDDFNKPESQWLKCITKSQDRTIVLGYLSIRKKKDPTEAAKSEQRMNTFRVVKDTLTELQDLQLKKAQLERGSTVLERKESVRQEIENLLDKIEDAKAKLDGAQREISGGNGAKNPTQLSSSSFAAQPHSSRSRRPLSASSSRGGGAPRSPRLANENSPVRRSAADGGRERPASATSAAAPPRAAEANPFLGTCFDRVSFDRPVSAAASSSRVSFTTVDRNRAGSDVSGSRVHDIGPGWNRNAIVPRMRHVALKAAIPVWGASHPADLAGSGGPPALSVRGVKATSVALGVNLEQDHYAQMCCGAAQRGL